MERHSHQQKLWRKAATSILALRYNISIALSFALILVLAIQWLLLEQYLQREMTRQTQSYGYQMAGLVSPELSKSMANEDLNTTSSLLKQMTLDPAIYSATLFDASGQIFASHSVEVIPEDGTRTLLYELDQNKLSGVLKLIIDEQSTGRFISDTLNKLTLYTIITAFLAIGIAWLLAIRMTAPVQKLLNTSLNDPDEANIEQLDISQELRQLLESPTNQTQAPAPVSAAEESGIHHLLASDSVARHADVVCLQIQIDNFNAWLEPKSGTPNIHLLRTLDRLLILTVHSQQGHLLSFQGAQSEACFALDGQFETAAYRAICCALMLERQLDELGLQSRFILKSENRLLIHHLKRTPVAIATQATSSTFPAGAWRIIIDEGLTQNPYVQEHFNLVDKSGNWYQLSGQSHSVDKLLERQLSWLNYLKDES